MVRVIKQPRWSFWTFEQIYECEYPPRCPDPLDLTIGFFEKRGIRNLSREPDAIRFERGTVRASLLRFTEIPQKQTVHIQQDTSRSKLTLTYRVFYPYPSINIPPWSLQKEARQLETWIEQNVNFSSGQIVASDDSPDGKSVSSGSHVVVRTTSNLILGPLYRIYRIFSGLRYWAMRRFTRSGLVVLGAGLITGIFGVDPESSVGYQAFTLALAMLFVAVLFTFRFKAKFSAERLLPRFGTAGQPFRYRVAVQNLTGKKQEGLILVENLADPRPRYSEWKALQLDDEKHTRPFSLRRRRTNPFKTAIVKENSVPPLPPGQRMEVSLELTPLRRGIVRFDGVTLARPDPLGLFRALRRVRLPQSVLILPKRYWIPPLALPGALKYQPGGVAMASNVGRSDEFVSLRDYRRGDAMRQIHWRSWAKAGKPIVKEVEDEFFVRHALVLDTFTERPHSDEFEEAVSVAASFACTVLTQESLLDLLFVGSQAYCFTAGRGLAHADQMLEILASVQPSHEPFDTLDTLVINHADAVSGCICVLLSWDEPRQRLVRKLKALGLPVLVLVISPIGKTITLEPGPMRDDPARLHLLEISRIEEQLAVMT